VETFTINLQPPQSSYLHTAFELKVPNQEVAEKVKVYMPEIRNGVIFLLSARQGAELVSHEGKQKLGSDLAAMMNGLLGKDGLNDAVQAVNFTSFIIQ
jgi:flagellar FliL protein